VPRVTGKPLVKAKNAITAAGLRAGQVSYTLSASVAKNDVISTNPSSGTQISKGSAVNLVVSKGPVPVASHPRSRHSQSASPAPTTRPPAPTSPAPASPAPTTRPPAPSPTPPSPSPSPTCIVNLLGICI
jgi:hypothetical protein